MFDFRFGTIASDPNSQSDLTLARSLRQNVDKVFAQRHLKRTTAFEVSEIQIAMQFVANGRALACPLQHRQATLFVGLPTTRSASVADAELSEWRAISIHR